MTTKSSGTPLLALLRVASSQELLAANQLLASPLCVALMVVAVFQWSRPHWSKPVTNCMGTSTFLCSVESPVFLRSAEYPVLPHSAEILAFLILGEP